MDLGKARTVWKSLQKPRILIQIKPKFCTTTFWNWALSALAVLWGGSQEHCCCFWDHTHTHEQQLLNPGAAALNISQQTRSFPKTLRLAQAQNDPALSNAGFLQTGGGTFSSSAGNLSLKAGKPLSTENRAKPALSPKPVLHQESKSKFRGARIPWKTSYPLSPHLQELPHSLKCLWLQNVTF